jgi:hypothetical protein
MQIDFYLVEKFVKQIKADLENVKSRLDRILDKYFGTEIPRSQLEKWYRSCGHAQ